MIGWVVGYLVKRIAGHALLGKLLGWIPKLIPSLSGRSDKVELEEAKASEAEAEAAKELADVAAEEVKAAKGK